MDLRNAENILAYQQSGVEKRSACFYVLILKHRDRSA